MQQENVESDFQEAILPVISKLILIIVLLVISLVAIPIIFYFNGQPEKQNDVLPAIVAHLGLSQQIHLANLPE